MVDKKGLSEIIGYVLLVIIALSLSLIVYTWIKGILPGKTEKCPDGVSLVIDAYECDLGKEMINITFKNQGRFNVDAAIIRFSNKSRGIPINILKSIGPLKADKVSGTIFFINSSLNLNGLEPNQKLSNLFSFKDYKKITEIEVVPLKSVEGKLLICNDAIIKQKIDGCGS